MAKHIYRFAPWFLLPLTFLLFGSSRWEMFGLLGVILLVALRWLAYGTPLPQTPLNPAILILLAMTALSLRVSPAPDLAVAAVGKILAGVIAFFVVTDATQTTEDLYRFAAVLVIVGVVCAYASPFTVTWMSDKVFSASFFYERNWTRLIEPINPNKMAGTIAPLIPLAVSLFFVPKRWMRILAAVSLPPMLVILVLLQSRGAFMALGVGAIVYLALAFPKSAPFLFGGSLVTAASILVFPSIVPPSLLDLNHPASAILSLGFRIELWQHALPLVLNSPIVGTGLAAFPYFAQAQFPQLLTEVRFSHVHNLVLQVALDTGIPGVLAYMAILVIALLSLWRAYRLNVERVLVIGLLAAFTVLLTHGMVDVIFWGYKPDIILWMMLALAVAFVPLTLQPRHAIVVGDSSGS